jgi:L-asparaginase II
MANQLPVLIEERRGAIIEAQHRGSVVAAEPDGRILARAGDEKLVTTTRSTIKPLQAIPFITSGAADRFNITPRELAVACASHDGEDIHTQAIAGMLERIGLGEGDLRCGAHPPYSEETARRLEGEGLPFTQLHNNCSGKHAGMLATAVHRGLATDDYVSADHPVQREIMSAFARMAGVEPDMPTAVDGCSAPTFGVPVISLAVAFARLVNPWSAPPVSPDVADAVKRIVAAMTAHPEMVGGTDGVFDTELMRAGRGSLVAKVGAKGVYSVGVLPSERFPRGLGIAIKMEDGDKGGLHSVVVEALAQLGVLDDEAQAALSHHHHPGVKNHRKAVVGSLCPVFDLGFGAK